jgi:dipeptidyl aminopeptidase/acylaminoacyl peptidase
MGGFSGKFFTLEGSENQLEIVLWNVDGNKIDTLWVSPTGLTVYGGEAKWSPTGEVLSVIYMKEGGYLVLLRPDGTEIITIRTGIHFYGGPNGQANWSPDGKWLVFSSMGDKDYVDIYKIGADGKNLVQLTNTYEEDNSPIFTPDGEHIIYRDVYKKDGGGNNLYIMDPDGSNQNLLIQGPAAIIDWSPDGKKALVSKAFTSYEFVLDVDSRVLSRFKSDRSLPFIGRNMSSPDGKWVLLTRDSPFSESTGPKFDDLFIMPSDESQEPLLFATVYHRRSEFRFSPDGKLILYYGWPVGQDITKATPGYYAIQPDGSGLLVLSDKAFGFVEGNWQPGSIHSDIGGVQSLVVTPTLSWGCNRTGSILGWTAWNQLKPLHMNRGLLLTESYGTDPYMGSNENLNIDAASLTTLKIEMRVSAGEWGQLFFITDSDRVFDEGKSFRFQIISDGQFHVYALDMSQSYHWLGEIEQIRLDPTENPAFIEIDCIWIEP